MRLTIFGLLFVLNSLTAMAQDLKLSCDAPTDVHPIIDISVEAKTAKVTLDISGNGDESPVKYEGRLSAKFTKQLKASLIVGNHLVVAAQKDAFKGGNNDFFTQAVSLYWEQKTPGLKGSQKVTVTLNNTVTVHTCTLR